MPNTVRLHRVLATKPDKIYRAFIEADAIAKWLPPNGFSCTVHHLDAKVGGTHRMSFRNFTTGMSHSRQPRRARNQSIVKREIAQMSASGARSGLSLRSAKSERVPDSALTGQPGKWVLVTPCPSNSFPLGEAGRSERPLQG
jgi:hypothetical protein